MITRASKLIRNEKTALLIFQFLVFALVCMDIFFDLIEGLPMKDIAFDLLLEGSILLLVIISSNKIWNKLHYVQETNLSLNKDLNETKKMAKVWENKSKEFIKEFQNHLIDRFDEWNLTKSEREIALLILKGHTAKDISLLRHTSQGTIKNQSRSIYEKSGLTTKNEFSAFFLNELIIDIDQEHLI